MSAASPRARTNPLNAMTAARRQAVNHCRRHMPDEALALWRSKQYTADPTGLLTYLDFNLLYASMPESERPTREELDSRRQRLVYFIYHPDRSVNYDLMAVFSDGARIKCHLRHFTDNVFADRFHYLIGETFDYAEGDMFHRQQYLCSQTSVERLCLFVREHVDPLSDFCVTPACAVPMGRHFHEMDRVRPLQPFTPVCKPYDHFVVLPRCKHPLPPPPLPPSDAWSQLHHGDAHVVVSQGGELSRQGDLTDLYLFFVNASPFRAQELARRSSHTLTHAHPFGDRVPTDQSLRLGMVYYRHADSTFHRTSWSQANVRDLHSLFTQDFDPFGAHLQDREYQYPVELCYGHYVVHNDGHVYATSVWGKVCLGRFQQMAVILEIMSRLCVHAEHSHLYTVQMSVRDRASPTFHLYQMSASHLTATDMLQPLGTFEDRLGPETWRRIRTPVTEPPPRPLFKRFELRSHILQNQPALEELEETDPEYTDDEETATLVKSQQQQRREQHYRQQGSTSTPPPLMKRGDRRSRGMRAVREYHRQFYARKRRRHDSDRLEHSFHINFQ